MSTLNKEYIKQTLKFEKLWKIGESDSFNFFSWNLTLIKEEEKYAPYKYSLKGTHDNGSCMSRRYKSMEDAFLHILNRFNENAAIKDKFQTLEDYIN